MITTIIVPTPPINTAGTTPNKAAVKPDSNSPSWFDVPINIEFTALTRPRISSGVWICTREDRMTTLMTSAAPSMTRVPSDSAKEVDSAKTIVATPKVTTAPNMTRPTRR